MKKIMFIIIFSFLSINLFAQEKKGLKQLLWDNVNPCYLEVTEEKQVEHSSFFDGVNNIDDTKNGYLKISGTYPTCGCFCSNIAGAYKQIDNNYTILANEVWSCSYTKKLNSNKALDSISPKDFGIADFIPKHNSLNIKNTNAWFYLNVEIPRNGTDTKVSLDFIPFGLDMATTNLISLEYSENNATLLSLYVINSIARTITNSSTLDCLLKNDYENISEDDMLIIKKQIGEEFKTIEAISNQLKTLKAKYGLYKLMEFKTIVLGWNKTESRFYIKEKLKASEVLSFKDFLIKKQYWLAAC